MNYLCNAVNAEKTQAPDQTEHEADLGTLSGSWMLIRGRESEVSKPYYPNFSQIKQKQAVRKIRHHIRDTFGKWKPSNVEPHGVLQLTMESCHAAMDQLKLPRIPKTKYVKINVDTGEQMCVADYELAKAGGP